MLTTVCFFREFTITKKAQRHPYNTRPKSKMDNEEGLQEQMKVDMSALKDQMASITKAILKIQKSIEDNATAAASNTAKEAEPVLQPTINLGRDKNATGFNRRYSPQAYPYGLPLDYTSDWNSLCSCLGPSLLWAVTPALLP